MLEIIGVSAALAAVIYLSGTLATRHIFHAKGPINRYEITNIRTAKK